MIKLYKHQSDELTLMKNEIAWAWFHETGTGKTILACENIKYLCKLQKIRAVIICAPKSVVRLVWAKTLTEEYSDIKFYLFNWVGQFNESSERIFRTVFGQDKANPNRLIILLVNTEAFSHKRILAYVKAVLLQLPTFWIIDESTNIKNPDAKRTKQILELSHLAEYRRILSGFPVLKSPADLWSQIQFLGRNLVPHKSFYAFRGDFCVMETLERRVQVFKETKNTEKLIRTIEPFSSRVLKKDCLDLPEKVRVIREVEMTIDQKSAYVSMKKKGYVILKGTDKTAFASTLLTQLSKLHQIANGMIISPRAYFTCNKFYYLIHLIENEICDNQFIVWACYTESIKMISLALNHAKIRHKLVYGDEAPGNRFYSITSFLDGKEQALVANPATIMHGLTFVNAHYAIYFNNSFNLEHRIQSEERMHRIGQTNKVTYFDLVSENTIEEKVLHSLEMKHSVGSISIGDEWEEWFQ